MSDTTDKSSGSGKLPIKIKFVCDVCGKGFQYLCHFQHHSRIHTGEKPCKCDICGRTFRTTGNANKHKKIHTDYKPFRCHICAKQFRRNSQLSVHVRIHTGEKPCRCNVCGMSFTSITNLRDHTSTHKERPFKCRKCDKTFHSTEGLAKHMPSHEKYKPCTCSGLDNASNFHKYNLQQSNFVKHNGERHMSGREMINSTQMHIGHLETFNNETSNSQLLTPVSNAALHICHLCDTEFPTSISLLEHMLVHADKSPQSSETEPCEWEYVW